MQKIKATTAVIYFLRSVQTVVAFGLLAFGCHSAVNLNDSKLCDPRIRNGRLDIHEPVRSGSKVSTTQHIERRLLQLNLRLGNVPFKFNFSLVTSIL